MNALKSLLIVSIATLASCTSTSSRQDVPRPSQDVEITSQEVCRIYVARADQLRGSLRSVLVYENDRMIGAIRADDYLCWERAPGRKIMKLVFEGRAIDAGLVPSLESVDAGAGEVLYYRIDLARKLDDPDIGQEWGKPLVTRLSREDGRALIAERDAAPVRKYLP